VMSTSSLTNVVRMMIDIKQRDSGTHSDQFTHKSMLCLLQRHQLRDISRLNKTLGLGSDDTVFLNEYPLILAV